MRAGSCIRIVCCFLFVNILLICFASFTNNTFFLLILHHCVLLRYAGESDKHRTRGLLELKLEEFKASGDSFETFMSKLPPQEVQLLWKDFERSREGHQDSKAQWEEVVSGAASTGLQKKKRALLHTFIKNGCKADHNYVSLVATTVKSVSQILQKTWQPWAAIELKYGQEEALSHVKCGAIKRKRNPQNAKYPVINSLCSCDLFSPAPACTHHFVQVLLVPGLRGDRESGPHWTARLFIHQGEQDQSWPMGDAGEAGEKP
jgi:hypothetical protein